MAGLSEITAVILAGGMGTRLREVVADKPKVLAEVNGRPFITYLLDQLADAGVNRVVLCTGYMAGLISASLGCHYRGMELQYSEETVPIGTGGAVRLALPMISSSPSPVLVMNGDSFCEVDLPAFVQQHKDAAARASLVLAQVSDISRYGAVELAADKVILKFEEKGGRQGQGLINAGIYLLEQSAIAAMPATGALSLERDLFPSLIGHGLFGFTQSGKFIDIGIPADYHAASSFFRVHL